MSESQASRVKYFTKTSLGQPQEKRNKSAPIETYYIIALRCRSAICDACENTQEVGDDHGAKSSAWIPPVPLSLYTTWPRAVS